MNSVELDGLTKYFDGRLILNEVSMIVHPRDIYGFLGPNGSGKTTTLRILLGILQRDKGSVSVLGMDPSKSGPALHRRVNALPESYGLYGWMTPHAYLHFFAQLYGSSLTPDECRVRLQQVGLDPDEQRAIKTFSHGMKQRLGIARAILNSPEILFLDEPTSGLDPRGRREIHDLLLKLNRENGVTIILSTHILDDVERLCNRIAILNRGKISYQGPLAAIQDERAIRYRFRIEERPESSSQWNYPGIVVLSKENDWLTCVLENLSPADAIKRLIEDNVAVVEAERLSGGLEDLYLSYTGESNT